MDPKPLSIRFTDFPDDVQSCILSFLSLSDLTTFASTSKHFAHLFKNDDKLWYNMCHRRWGSKTLVHKWGNGKTHYKILYKTLMKLDNVIGFWRLDRTSPFSPPLVLFEWGPCFVVGSWVSPGRDGTYEVIKSPFLWITLSSGGDTVSFLDPESEHHGLIENHTLKERNLLSVSVGVKGSDRIIVRENVGYGCVLKSENRGVEEVSIGTCNDMLLVLPERFVSEIRRHCGDVKVVSGNVALMKQKRRERQAIRKWDAECFVKVVDTFPTPSRPLQGLWKGISETGELEFYHVTYDEIGGITLTCRSVREPVGRFHSPAPVFWTSNVMFLEPPFSPKEIYLFDSRSHLQPLSADDDCLDLLSLAEKKIIRRILPINSSFDIVIPDLAGKNPNPQNVEGRIWQYGDGTFGFGFLRDNFIINLKQIIHDGHLLDVA